MTGIEDFADKHAEAQFAENQEIARSLRAVRADASESRNRIKELESRLELFEGLEEAQLLAPDWLIPKKASKQIHTATPAFVYTDAHTGETVDPGATDGLNAYNREISALRHRRFFEKAIVTARDYLSGVSYDGTIVFSTGDDVSGLIHEELQKTNAETIMESVLSEAEFQEAGFRMLADAFGKLHVVKVPGNHGRYKMGRPEHKSYNKNNFDWLIGRLVAKELRADDRITFTIADAPNARAQVYDTRFLVTHGFEFKGGTGISGALAPLMLGTHRKTRREAMAGKLTGERRDYDCMVMGHLHQRISLPARGVLVGGCLKGYDEFAYDYNFEPDEPTQEAFLITPERGITFNWPIHVMDRKAEGW